MREEELIVCHDKMIGEVDELAVRDFSLIHVEVALSLSFEESLERVHDRLVAVRLVEEFFGVPLARMERDVVVVEGDPHHEW